MKSIHFVFLLCGYFLLANNGSLLFAQSVPLLRPDNLWSVLENREEFGLGFPDYKPAYKLSHWLKTGKDTVINMKTYKTILYATDESHSVWEEYTALEDTEKLLMREENGKVYRYYEGETREETLLYDFNMQEGDSISQYLDPGSLHDERMYSKVDSIRYTRIDNIARKKYYISKYLVLPSTGVWGKTPEVWIEGIGSLLGPDRKSFSFSYGNLNIRWDLLCFYQNDRLLYHSPNFDDCYYHWVSGNPKVEPGLDFQVFPNPSSGKFTMKTEAGSGDCPVRIFDMNGKLIRSYRMDNSGILEVDLSGFPKGIYMVQIKKQGNFCSKKIAIK